MNNFKKVLLSMLGVVLIFSVLSAAMISPFLHSEMMYYQDIHVRDEVAGTIDTLIIGASNSLCAVQPSIMDKALECNSYNLSSILQTMDSKQLFLAQEVEKNPVRTVIMDISSETLVRDENAETAKGDSISLAKISTLKNKLYFLLRTVHIDDWVNIYSRLSFIGMEWWLSILSGHNMKNVDYAAKGFYSRDSNNIELSPKDVNSLYNSLQIDTLFRTENLEKLVSQVEYCKRKGIKVIFTVIPKSDSTMWMEDGHDEFFLKFKKIAAELECPLYDMNLLKDRYSLWNDRESFFDGQHMSAEGAASFTEAFCDILKKAETEDVSDYFYDSYEEMKADSPYMKYLGGN